MSFATDIAAIPLTARQTDAKGFLPPIIRATGHLLFVLADAATEEGHRILTDDEALEELTHAKGHWDAITTNEAISTPTKTLITAFGKAVSSAITEFPDWDRNARITNLRDLGNRAAGISAALDRELVGLRDSDAGLSL